MTVDCCLLDLFVDRTADTRVQNNWESVIPSPDLDYGVMKVTHSRHNATPYQPGGNARGV